MDALERHHLTTYQAYLVIILAAQYQCPARDTEAYKEMVDALERAAVDCVISRPPRAT